MRAGRACLKPGRKGLFLLARLSAGKYEVNATLDGVSVRHTTTIAATGMRQLVFRWVVPQAKSAMSRNDGLTCVDKYSAAGISMFDKRRHIA